MIFEFRTGEWPTGERNFSDDYGEINVGGTISSDREYRFHKVRVIHER